ncbi:MAG: hypothetical protein ACRDY1_09160, partial [Acidimicrobiales bacterium]
MTGDGETTTRRLSPAMVAPTLTLLGWAAFAWYLFWQGTAGYPLLWSDSTSYATIATHPFWSTGFWAGQRPPLVPFLLKVAGTANGYVALQSVLAAAAWGLLAFTVGRLVSPGWRRLVAAWVVLAFASTTPITLWDRSVLSESPSLSLLAVVMAAVIWAARRLTLTRIAVVVGLALAFAFTRDAQVWTVAALGVVVVGVVGVRILRRRPFPGLAAILAIGLLVVAAVPGWLVVHTGRSRQNIADDFYVRIFPFPARVAWFAAHGLPDPGAIDRGAAASAAPSPGAAKVIGPDQIGTDYNAIGPWVTAHGESTYLLWLVTHPTFIVTEPLARPERAYNFADGLLSFYAPLGWNSPPTTPVLWPAWWWLLPLTAVGLGTAAVKNGWREHSFQALVMLSALGIFTMLVAWQGDGQEVTRHTVEGFAEVRAGVLILALVGVLRLVPT